MGTFHGWVKRSREAEPGAVFAEVEVARSGKTAVEVHLPNGTRVALCHEGEREELIAMVRGIAGC